ncbi:MAG TPA: hypothetical protein VGQ32_00545, partial [Thermoanaerobaculia bacterium]|nr:hypothetical protein [Thermoanaerobaculia bacterium]
MKKFLFAAALLIPALGFASGPSSPMSAPQQRRDPLTPEQEAVGLFNDGTEYQEKAAKYEKEAAAEPDAAKKAKLEGKAKDKHEDAI